MQVTFLRGSGASERELEALAIYMGGWLVCVEFLQAVSALPTSMLASSSQRWLPHDVCCSHRADICSCDAGHSVEMQRSTYDRRTMAAKVEPAVDLLESLNQQALKQS